MSEDASPVQNVELDGRGSPTTLCLRADAIGGTRARCPAFTIQEADSSPDLSFLWMVGAP